MMADSRTTLHPSEGDLVRYLDRQVPAAEAASIEAHLAGCERCQRELELLRERSAEASQYIGSLDADARADDLTRARAVSAARDAAARARRPRIADATWLRAAAAVLVLLVGSLGITPVRAWVGDQWEALVGGDAEPATAIAPAPVLDRGSVVSFQPAGDVFVLEVRHAQEAGSVHIELQDVARASARILNGGDEAILVLPAGLQIENSEGSSASYSITLPNDLRLVQVFAEGRPIAILPVEDGQGWSTEVPLTERD